MRLQRNKPAAAVAAPRGFDVETTRRKSAAQIAEYVREYVKKQREGAEILGVTFHRPTNGYATLLESCGARNIYFAQAFFNAREADIMEASTIITQENA